MGIASLHPSYGGRTPPSTAQPVDRIGRGCVDEAELHALLALPPVERERAEGVDCAAAAREQGLAELLPHGAKGDGVDGAAVARQQADAHMGLADLLGKRNLMGRQ